MSWHQAVSDLSFALMIIGVVWAIAYVMVRINKRD